MLCLFSFLAVPGLGFLLFLRVSQVRILNLGLEFVFFLVWVPQVLVL